MDLRFVYSEISHKGKVRQKNEDSCQVSDTTNGTLFVVCDGMGGAAEGKKASSIAVTSIIEFFNKEIYENLQIALYNSLAFANEQIYATAQMYPSFKGMGTTACVVLINDENIYFAHVGDSRIYLYSKDSVYQLTKDHSFVNQLVDQGTITVEESKLHKNKNRILKALGVHQKVEPTVSSQSLLLIKDDLLFICSDGLNDMVVDDEIKEIIKTKDALLQKTKLLLEKALENGGEDNITIQGLQILESPHKKTVFIDKTLYTEGYNKDEKYKKTNKKARIKLVVLILISIFLLGIYLIVTYKAEVNTVEDNTTITEQAVNKLDSVNANNNDLKNNLESEKDKNKIESIEGEDSKEPTNEENKGKSKKKDAKTNATNKTTQQKAKKKSNSENPLPLTSEAVDSIEEINEKNKENTEEKKQINIPDYVVFGEQTNIDSLIIKDLSDLNLPFNLSIYEISKINNWPNDIDLDKVDTIYLTNEAFNKSIKGKELNPKSQ